MCTLGNKREIKTLKFVSASTKCFKGGLAWIKPSKKDMAVTFSYCDQACACECVCLPRTALKAPHTGVRVCSGQPALAERRVSLLFFKCVRATPVVCVRCYMLCPCMVARWRLRCGYERLPARLQGMQP